MAINKIDVGKSQWSDLSDLVKLIDNDRICELVVANALPASKVIHPIKRILSLIS